MEHSDFILFPKVCVNIRYFSLELCKQMSVSEFCLNWGKNDYVKRNIFEKSLYGKLLILWLCYGCAIYYECVLYIERGTQWIFVDWINVMQFYHRSSKSFFFCSLPIWFMYSPSSLHRACYYLTEPLFQCCVLCCPKWLVRIGRGNLKPCSDETEPTHVAGAHPNLSCFIEAVRLMDIRKEYSRSITTTSSVLQPGKSSSGLSPVK